jgi:hypothetical protein
MGKLSGPCHLRSLASSKWQKIGHLDVACEQAQGRERRAPQPDPKRVHFARNIRMQKPKWKPHALLLVLAFFLSICSLGWYRFCTAKGVLHHYGVSYNDDAVKYESSSLNSVWFWFDGPHGKLDGPLITGDLLFVQKPYRTPDGHLEFAVQSRVYRDARVRIQLIAPPLGEIAFRVIEPVSGKLSVHYPPQPELPAWP